MHTAEPMNVQPSPYLHHLAAVHETRCVSAAENIWTLDGVVAVRSGDPLPWNFDRILLARGLRKPLPKTVNIDCGLTAGRIRDDIIGTFPPRSLPLLLGRFALDDEIERGAAAICRYPLLVQQLTVLALRLPFVYQQALVVTWLSAVTAMRMNMHRGERMELFIGALTHSIGMLHIEPEIACRVGDLQPKEWQEIQRYVECGRALLADVPGLAPEVARMVGEHRELPDGTGYPCHLEYDELQLPGQIIGTAQSLASIYLKPSLQNGHAIRDLVPVLQVNSKVYRSDRCFAMIKVLRELSTEESALGNDAIEGATSRLLAHAALLESNRLLISGTIDRLTTLSTHPAVRRAVKVYRHLERILSSSGILDPALARWMQQVVSTHQRAAYREIEDLVIMLREVHWQMKRLVRVLEAVATSPETLEDAQRCALLDDLARIQL